MNTDPGKTMITCGDVLRLADGMQRLSARSQGKTYLRACRFLEFRLYDPRIGRFLSPDSPGNPDFSSPGGLDLCAYCLNDPIGFADHTGYGAVAILISVGIGALLGAIGGTAGALISDYNDNGSIDGSINFRSYLGSIVGGIIGGFLSYSGDKWILGKPWDPRRAFIRGGLTAIEGIIAFGAGGVASLVTWDGGKTIRIGKHLINVPETIVQNFVSDIFGNPSGWLLDLIMEYFYG